jgi:DsbC/DsbD-like thiol-disulfide interchange protein
VQFMLQFGQPAYFVYASNLLWDCSIQMANRSLCRLLWFLLVSVLWPAFPLFGSYETIGDKHLQLQLISEEDALVPGQEVWLGIRFDLPEGWHTYWINPGDSGEAPRIQWHLPAGFEAGEIQWPYPERLGTPPFTDYGYQHQALLIVPIRPPAQQREGETEKFAAVVHYLVCKDVCIPGQEQLELSLPVKNHAAISAAHELFETTRSRLPRPVPPQWKISVVSARDEFHLDLKSRELAGRPQFFPLQPEQIENAASQDTTPIPGGIRLHLKKSTHLLKPVVRLKGVIVLGSGKAYLIDAPVWEGSRRART